MHQKAANLNDSAQTTSQNWGEIEFCRLLEKLPAGAYTCDPQGLITYYNQHAANLWGRAPKLNDPVDRFCGSFKLFSADGAPIRHEQCWMALALNQNREYNEQEILVQRPDGQQLTVLAHANPIRDETGRLLGAVNVLVDISDRKRGEEELRQADRSKDEFLAMLAHELRNPLAPVRSAVDILELEQALSPDAKWALQVIDRQVGQMTRLIDDLMDISRITRNKLELRRARVELAEVIRTAVETSRPLIESAKHNFEMTLPSQPVYLDADATRLAQAISNLLNNAAKYTESGGHIWLTAERQGSDAVVTVRDTGIGIPADMLPRVFDLFTQAHGSLNRSRGGLGIGLTLVKRIIEMHGGSIRAHSEGQGMGSSFNVRLPVIVEAIPQRHSDRHQDRESTSAAALRILVVDDNPDAVNSLAMLLRISGHDIRTACDGVEAIDVAQEFRPDAALLDIGMPRLNGFEAARHLRQQPWGKKMVLVAVTGWGQDGDKCRSRESGFDHHMVKPVDPRELLKLLASLRSAVPT